MENQQKRKIEFYDVLMVLARVLVGSAFLFSAWGKLLAPVEEFQAVLTEHGLLSAQMVPGAAFVIPWLELIFGTCVLLGFMTRFSAGGTALFLMTFILVLTRSVLLHLPILECGCFGDALQLTPLQAVVLDCMLLILSIALIRNSSARLSLDGLLTRSSLPEKQRML